MEDRERTREQLVEELDALRRQVAGLKEGGGQRQSVHELLRRIVEGTASATGEEFFRSLVRNLASTLQVRHAFVSEFTGGTSRVRTLAFWKGEGFLDSFEYDLAGTPCEQVLRGEICHYREGVQALFPQDKDLVKLGAESYLAIPMTDDAGTVLGHLAVLDDKPMPDEPHHLSILKIFTARAVAELQRKRAEELDKEAGERFRKIFHYSNDAIFIIDPERDRILEANPMACTMLGYSHEELLLTPITAIHPKEMPQLLAFAQSVFAKGYGWTNELTCFTKTGQTLPAEISGSVIEMAGRPSLIALVRNITERKRMETALKEREEQVRLLLESTAEAIYGVDLEGNCTFCNPASLRILRYGDKQDLIGKNMHALIHHTRRDGTPYPVEECQVYQSFQKGEGIHLDDEILWRGDGTLFRAECWSYPVRRDQELIGSVVTFVDITDRKLAEEALLERQRLALLSLHVSNALTQSETLRDDLRRCAEGLVQYLDVAFARIWTVNEEENVLDLQASAGMYTRIDGSHAHVPVGKFKIGLIAQERRPHLTNSVIGDPRIHDQEWVKREGMVAFAGYPLIVGDRLVGVMAMFSRMPLTETTLQAMESVANKIALGIDRKRTELKFTSLQHTTSYLQEEIKAEHNFEELLGASPAMRKVFKNVETVAVTDSLVLVTGETGTGKELITRAIHNRSKRKGTVLVKVNCAALPAGLIESELFGHEKGAFTGALSRKIGRFELADRGTIFLDEIGELPLDLQAKLLRVLQEGEFERVGSARTFKVDVRVIAASNRDLEKSVQDGQFRSDLFYRLNVFPIHLPPLRERKRDIPLLVKYFVQKFNAKLGKKIETVPERMMEALETYPWPGNVRELEHVIERAMIVSQDSDLELGEWLVRPTASVGKARIPTLEELEREHIQQVLKVSGWRVSGEKGAAQLLGLKPTTLEARMRKLGIVRKQ
ncbi:sigma 54-interacting transcriptional regulator [Nitrospiraceae bacterium AH_259_D15_M11_P09]|nr:sigma 54-interacting transcriptional regulator [Nitrospiraceae bacterium AH_259_D15_M11_P09]